MQDTPVPEVAVLRQEIEKLKEQLLELKQFVEVIPADQNKGIPAFARVKCSSLLISSPASHKPRAIIAGTEDGSQLLLFDSAGRARFAVQASNSPNVTIIDSKGGAVVEVGVEENAQRGRVLVSDHGHPRAIIKATPEGGCVSVLHDDGRPRASIISTAHQGAELLMISPDLKPALRASSGAENGGLLSVHRSNGRPAVTLLSGKKTSGVVVTQRDGTIKSLP